MFFIFLYLFVFLFVCFFYCPVFTQCRDIKLFSLTVTQTWCKRDIVSTAINVITKINLLLQAVLYSRCIIWLLTCSASFCSKSNSHSRPLGMADRSVIINLLLTQSSDALYSIESIGHFTEETSAFYCFLCHCQSQVTCCTYKAESQRIVLFQHFNF